MTDKKAQIISSLKKLRNLPTIPKVIFEVSNLLKEQPVNNIKLAETISKDQGLTTKVLVVANSPIYGLQRKVSSLEFAILLLGAEEITNIVTAVSLADTIKFNDSSNFRYMDYWKHSMIVGSAARDIARRLSMSELAGDAFLAGMLHDLGIQLLIKHFPREYRAILEMVANEGVSFLSAEERVLGCTHQEIGGFLAQKWELPGSLCNVMEFHHRPQDVSENLLLVSIVHLADSMTHEFKVGDVYWDLNAEFETMVSEILGFSSLEKLAEFTADYKVVFEDTAESIKL